MTDPIVFIVRNRVKEGMLDDFTRHYLGSIPVTQSAKPGTLVQLAYVNDSASEITIVRVFPDAEALDQQLQGADNRSKVAYQFIEPTSIEIYGTPNRYALEMMKKVAGSGIEVSIYPGFAGGFIRGMPD
jgi:hypothetical protein